MDEKEGARESDLIKEPDAGPESIAVEGSAQPQGTPGTHLVEARDDEEKKVFKTIHVSSSAKARARIRTCEKCRHDNIPEARYCEGCGDDIDAQEQKKEFEQSMKQLEEYSEKTSKAGVKKDGGTMLRRRRTPVMQPPVDIEKKSYHSHYIPPGTPAVQQFDPAGFRSDPASGYQVVQQQMTPPQGYIVQPGMQQQYVAVPLNYSVQVAPKGKSASFIIGVIVLSFLALALIALIVTIVVLAL